jgi:hypothetical protein
VDTTVNPNLPGLEMIDESHVATSSDLPDVEMIDEPSRASSSLTDTTVNPTLLGLETIDEDYVATSSDLPDVGIIGEPPRASPSLTDITANPNLLGLETIDESHVATSSDLPEVGIIDEPSIVNDRHTVAIIADTPDLGHEITTANASATVVATTLVTGITSPPSIINPGHGVCPGNLLPLRHEAESLTNITNINEHAVVLPHTSTPRHQRKHVSIHNDNSLSPLIRGLEVRLALEEAAAAEMAAAAAASQYPNLLPVISQPSRPLYVRALAERAATEAAAAATTTPTPPTPALVAPAPAPSQRAPKHNENTTSVMEAPVEEETGRRTRRLTVFGAQCEKAVAEQKAKAAKAAIRRADREKVANVKANEERVKSIGAGSKKIAVRGKKGKKRM